MSGDLWHARNAALVAIDLGLIVLCGTLFVLREKQARIETGVFVEVVIKFVWNDTFILLGS